MLSEEFLNPKMTVVLTKQLNNMIKKSSEGIKLIQQEQKISVVQAEITGPKETPFEGGIFRCQLNFTSDFPRQPPKGFFLTKIFHPNISEKGEICVNTLKKDWDPNSFSLENILQVIRCLLIIPFPESALNEEAAKLFMEDYEQYYRHAKLITDLYAKQSSSFQESNVMKNGGQIQQLNKAFSMEEPLNMNMRQEKKRDSPKKPLIFLSTNLDGNSIKENISNHINFFQRPKNQSPTSKLRNGIENEQFPNQCGVNQMLINPGSKSYQKIYCNQSATKNDKKKWLKRL